MTVDDLRRPIDRMTELFERNQSVISRCGNKKAKADFGFGFFDRALERLYALKI
jgi:hypothetical protein